MAINTIDEVRVNNSNQIYGGYIFNVRYTPSFGQDASQLSIQVVSENGEYNINKNDLNTNSPDTITIGNNLSLQMYPIKYTKQKSDGGKILIIDYVDTSIILDKRIIGLDGRMGDKNEDNKRNSCFIILGRSLLRDGQTRSQVLEKVYYFQELCEGIAENGIPIADDSKEIIKNASSAYFASYYGTLRTVLASWCADLGLGFFWENNQLHFVDLKTSVQTVDLSQFNNYCKTSEDESVSIEDTVGRVAASFYGKDGESGGEFIDNDTTVGMAQIKLKDLGYTQEDIESIKAAFAGRDWFFAYHFYLNKSSANGILGIEQRKEDQGCGAEIAPHDPSSQEPVYSKFYWLKIDETRLEGNYQLATSIVPLVGRFYSRRMKYGYYKRFTSWSVPVAWYPNNTKVKDTIIAGLANRNNGDQSISSFLTGDEFRQSGYDENGQYRPGNEGDDDVETPDSDVRSGVVIADLGEQAWLVGGTPISFDEISQELEKFGVGQFYPRQILIDNFKRCYADEGVDETWSLYGIESDANVSLRNTWTAPDEQQPLSETSVDVFRQDFVRDGSSKIETYLRTDVDRNNDKVTCRDNVMRYEINYREINEQDFEDLIPQQTFFPNLGINITLDSLPNSLTDAHEIFNKQFVVSKAWESESITFDVPFIDFPDNYLPSIQNGLESLNIEANENGVNTTYTFGTRLMIVPSLEVIRSDIRRARGTEFRQYRLL